MSRDAGRLVVVAAFACLLATGWAAIRIWQQGESDERRPAGALVALGAAQYDGRPSPVLAARLDHAIALFLGGGYRYLVVTGGKATGDRTTEAAVARDYAIRLGVPADRILLEDRGRTTLESLEGVRLLLRANGVTDAVFVSDRTHMLRVLRMASDLGIVGWGSPTTSSPTDQQAGLRFASYAHEIAALAEYFVLGGSPANELAGQP